jgi:hypothetical protein
VSTMRVLPRSLLQRSWRAARVAVTPFLPTDEAAVRGLRSTAVTLRIGLTRDPHQRSLAGCWLGGWGCQTARSSGH